jgi:hypothetical protein
MRILHFTNTQVGATLFVERSGRATTWQVHDPELYARIDPSLAEGELLTFWQEAARECQIQPSDRAQRKVDSGPPPAPWISVPPCPGSKMLHVEGLVPTATVKLMLGDTELLVFQAAEESADLDLAGLVLAPGQKLTVVQGLCNVFGPPSVVPATVTAPAVGVAPGIPERLVACAGVVRVNGLAPGAYVEVFSGFIKGRIGHAWSTSEVVDVLVSPPLLAPVGGTRDHVRAEVSGCAAGTAEREVDPAADLPPFQAAVPLEQDRSIHVMGVVPGCLLDVDIDGQWASEMWAAASDVRVPVPDVLRQGQHVDVTARLCSQHRSAPQVVVAPPLTVNWQPATGMGIAVGANHMSGRVQAALPLGPAFGNVTLVGTEASGLWTVRPGVPSLSLSLDWSSVQIRCLAYGSKGPGHLYCGTTNGMMETDPGAALPLLSWKRVDGLPGSTVLPLTPVAGASIADVLVLPGHNTVVVATNSGVWSSPIAPPAPHYAWSSDPIVNTGTYTALCEGPDESVIAYRAGAPGGQFAVGTWTPGGYLDWVDATPGVNNPSSPLLDSVVARMTNGSLSSSKADRRRVYAAVADVPAADGSVAWLAVLRSDTGGKTWYVPYTDPTLGFFQSGGGGDMGLQADRNLKIGAHPVLPDTVLVVGRRTGPIGSIDGCVNWDTGRWQDISGNGTFHADSLCITFDPGDPSGNTILVGSDGGLFVSADLASNWDNTRNQFSPTLMFDQQYQSSAPAMSASAAFPGVLVGALQDNGTVYLKSDGDEWQQLEGGDGNRALFVTSDVAVRGSNNGDQRLLWARWDGAKSAFTDAVELAPPGYPDGSPFLPKMSRIPFPSFTDPSGGALMVTLAADDPATGDIFGLFDKGAGTDPESDRFYWKKLGTAPFQATAVGAFDGRVVLVGTTNTHLYQLNPLTGDVAELTLPSGLGQATARWMTVAGPSVAFCLLGGSTLLRSTNLVSWVTVAGPAGTSLEALSVDFALDPVALFVAGSNGAWISRDLGASWSATSGLPKVPSANHLEAVDYGAAGRAVHLGTWNWSVWRAPLP